MSTHRYGRIVPAFAVVLAVACQAFAQTKIVAPRNSYSVAEDVKLGREASAEVRKELPMLNDGRVDEWVEDIGATLVRAIPAEFQHAEFRYTFDVINQKEINAFALPGGPMYLNRGMIEAAKTEGEVAGVMAHEISHVALRHGTAQATKGQGAAILGTLGQIGGAIIGGGLGQILSAGSQIGAGLKLMQYSREFESQADLLGAQILARAGYDPREMANMFRTIEKEGGGGGPQWMSSHPNPGNRYNAIMNESRTLRVQGNANTGQFQSIQARLDGMSPALTAEQIARGQKTGAGTVGGGTRTVRVDPPSNSYRTRNPSEFLRVAVPSNWDEVSGARDGVTYAPDGAFFQGDNGGTAFTHGVQIGVTQGTGNLQRDTQRLLNAFAQSNPNLRQQTSLQRDNLGGRNGYTTILSNVSEVTGQRERIALSTTQLRNGSLLYVVGVAPQSEAQTYDPAFRRVRQSVQIRD
ncbi:MAG TPA: M48 family metallopeptidase [Vicinamibacterales bacterium]|nr:M48 family metallopeptidase [Vicinamibacterales bacterium]